MNLQLAIVMGSIILMAVGSVTVAMLSWEGAKTAWRTHPAALVLSLSFIAFLLIWAFAGILWAIGIALAAGGFVVWRAM